MKNVLQQQQNIHFNPCVFLVFPSTKDPKMYVQTVLDVHKKYNALVMSAFNNDAGFVAALDKVNNHVTVLPVQCV